MLLPHHASCVLLPALEFACARGESIQGANPSEIPGYPTTRCPSSCPNQPSVGSGRQSHRTGSRNSPSGNETTTRTVGNPSSNPNRLLAPSFSSAGEPGLQREKLTSQSRGVFQTLLLTASARTTRQPAGKGGGSAGEGRGRSKPPHAKERAPPRLLAACLWPPPPAPPKGELAPRR